MYSMSDNAHCIAARLTNDSHTNSHSSLPDLIGGSSSSGESSRSDDELPELESIEQTAVEYRKISAGYFPPLTGAGHVASRGQI